MITALTRVFYSLLFLPLSVLTFAAQEKHDEKWYKVELLVFSRVHLVNEDSEKWDPTPTLLYPSSYQFLIDPEAQIATKTNLDPNQADPNQANEPNQPSDISETNPRPTPLTLLAPSERMFLPKVQQMKRSGQYNIQFHQSWLQPMVDRDNATDIVLDHSGDNEQWPALQGSVKFYLSRYLHVETNLWLNTLGDYLPQSWQMPAPPLGPVSRPSSDLELLLITHDSDAVISAEAAEEPSLVASEELLTTDLPTADIPPIYPWRHALPLQQKRRMRSTEIHYIDHPAIGVVIQITPVEKEELVQRAAQEAAQALP